jgi:hypothetical protein
MSRTTRRSLASCRPYHLRHEDVEAAFAHRTVSGAAVCPPRPFPAFSAELSPSMPRRADLPEVRNRATNALWRSCRDLFSPFREHQHRECPNRATPARTNSQKWGACFGDPSSAPAHFGVPESPFPSQDILAATSASVARRERGQTVAIFFDLAIDLDCLPGQITPPPPPIRSVRRGPTRNDCGSVRTKRIQERVPRGRRGNRWPGNNRCRNG